VTGERVVDYLKPRLFEPLGITDVDSETSPTGNSTGGWGLRLRTEDLAKFGQLLLQKGVWNGKRVLAADWIELATSRQILQSPDAPRPERERSDWLQGYGFQFWRCRHGGFRADGAFGQYIIVLPDQDAVIVITSETKDMQGILNLVWEHLLPSMQPDRLPDDREALARLRHTSRRCRCPRRPGAWLPRCRPRSPARVRARSQRRPSRKRSVPFR
jgi:CubicO group peptidase (beta-lactamase class C family)